MNKYVVLLFLMFCATAWRPVFAADTLVLGYTITPPFLEKTNQELTGPSWWLWNEVAQDLNLKLELVELPHDSLLHSLKTGKIDGSLSPLTVTSDRLEIMDFTAAYHVAYSSLMVQKVTRVESARSFLNSFFSANFIRALSALAILIFVFGFLAFIFERKRNREEFGEGIDGLWDGFWWSAVTMTTVGYGDKSPRTVGGRIVALIWMFTAIIVISGFTASIASSLTVNRMDEPGNAIQNFKDNTLGTINQSATEKWLRHNYFPNRLTYSTVPEMIEALDAGLVEAVAYDGPVLQNVLKNSGDKYEMLDVKYNPQFYATALTRDLPEDLRDKITMITSRHMESMEWNVLLSEHGLIEHF